MPKNTSPTTQITDQLKNTLPEHSSKPIIQEIGEVVYIGDGVLRIKGLPTVRIEDLVEVDTGDTIVPALVLGINEKEIEAVVMADYTKIRQGNVVRSTGQVLVIPAGEALLGRVVDPLGNPVDGLGPIHSHTVMPVEALAPGVAKRAPVDEQFESGVLVVDTIIPLGRGQRELVIGDRKSGKTKLVENFITNQKGKDIYCFYVAIGAQRAKIRGLEERLRKAGAMDYTTIVLAGSDDPPSLNFIAPYAGTALAEYFVYQGKNAIIFYDDLSKQAKSYRQMSLLLKRSPGRDAYPGDIFYLHSHLLERSAKFHEKLNGGSLTGFPMAETQNGDLSEYICTNLMSITDGHIYLDVNMMHEGILPAVNSGASVSRIGGGVQPTILRKLGELASAQMARYNEVKSFETLNTEITEETEREIKRGKRILILFGQDSRLTLDNPEKTLLMHLVTSGKMDNVEVADVAIIRDEIIPFYRKGNYQEYKERSVTEKDLGEVDKLIVRIITDYLAVSAAPTARLMIEEDKPEPNAAPIVPDPNQQKEGSKEPEKDSSVGEAAVAATVQSQTAQKIDPEKVEPEAEKK